MTTVMTELSSTVKTSPFEGEADDDERKRGEPAAEGEREHAGLVVRAGEHEQEEEDEPDDRRREPGLVLPEGELAPERRCADLDPEEACEDGGGEEGPEEEEEDAPRLCGGDYEVGLMWRATSGIYFSNFDLPERRK